MSTFIVTIANYIHTHAHILYHCYQFHKIKMSADKIYKGYEKLKVVGQGSFGRATLYKRIADGKCVVMKEIYTLDLDDQEKKDALNEVEILSTLNHPNIISYFGSFENDGALVIIMEYADGGNLAQLINAKKNKNEIFTESSILSIVQQICSAMAYMHNNKILHRDLKSANIFLNMNGSVKVGDFGISKVLNTKSQAQTVVGTPYYLSPEMCEGSDYNEKSDVWAIGCILYELACLRKPFEAMTLPVLVQKITACQYENIPYYYSQDLSQLVRSILQINASYRPSAKLLCNNAIPKIRKKNLNNSKTNIVSNNFLKPGDVTERSILYKMSNFGDDHQLIPIELPHKKILSFDSSQTHQIAIASDNMVYTWGENNYGQLALGKSCHHNHKGYPVCVNSLRNEKIVQCAAGNNFSIFLNENGNVLSCGNGQNGCLGHGNWNNLWEPTKISSLADGVNISQICCGDEHVVALSSEGKVFSWGSAEQGALGQGHSQFRCTPLAITAIPKVKKVFCGKNASALLATNGQLFVAGNNDYRKLGVRNLSKMLSFVQVNLLIKDKIQFISLGLHQSAVLTENGFVVVMGGSENEDDHQPKLVKFQTKINMVSCCLDYIFAVDQENVLWCWGGTFKKYKKKSTQNNAKSGNAVIPMVQDETQIIRDIVKETDFELESVKIPRSILALYSSKMHIKLGNVIYFGNIYAQENELFVMLHTTTPPVVKQFTHNELHKSKTVNFQENYVTSSLTKLPNIP